MTDTENPRERFEQLFRTHHAAVDAFVRRRASSDAAEDIISETFLVAWRRLDRVPEESLPWLLGVARNVIGTARRTDARRLRLQARVQAEWRPPAEIPELAVDPGRVSAALDRLTERDREALTLIAWDGLTPSQAATVIGIPANRFRVRLHRAARRLRWALAVEPDETSDPGPRVPRHITVNHESRGGIA